MLTLKELSENYFSERDCGKGHRDGVRLVVKWFGEFLHRTATVGDLTDENVNAWLTSMVDRGLSRRTVRGRRVILLSLWRAAFEDGKVDAFPRRVKKINVPRLIPSAWTPQQVGAILKACDSVDGYFKRSKVKRSTTLRASVVAFWHSGLRLGDMMRLKWSDIGDDGSVAVVQNKTGFPHACCFPPEAMAAIAPLRGPGRTYVFRDVVSYSRLKVYFRIVVRSAGLRGGTKKLRKSGATAVEKASPGSAPKYCGHRPGSMVAYQHYVDPTLLGGNSVQPPNITIPTIQPTGEEPSSF